MSGSSRGQSNHLQLGADGYEGLLPAVGWVFHIGLGDGQAGTACIAELGTNSLSLQLVGGGTGRRCNNGKTVVAAAGVTKIRQVRAVSAAGDAILFLLELHGQQSLERIGASGVLQSVLERGISDGSNDGHDGDHDHQFNQRYSSCEAYWHRHGSIGELRLS